MADAHQPLHDGAALVARGVGELEARRQQGRVLREVGRAPGKALHPLRAGAARLGATLLHLLPVDRRGEHGEKLLGLHALVTDAIEELLVGIAGDADEQRGQSLPGVPEDVAALAAAPGHEGDDERPLDQAAVVEPPELDRTQQHAAAGDEDAIGRAVEQQQARTLVGEGAVALASRLDALLPGIAQLVGGGLREGVARLPEGAQEGLALVVAAEREEDLPLLGNHQRRDLLEPVAIALGEVGGNVRRRGLWRLGGGR